MIAQNLKHDKAPQSLMTFTLDTFQLNNTSFLFDPLLDKIIKVCLYNLYKNAVTFSLLAQAAVKTDKNNHMKTKNAIFIDITLIRKSQFKNIIDRDSLSDCLNISLF